MSRYMEIDRTEIETKGYEFYWDVAHRWARSPGIGHYEMHSGDRLWLRAHTMLAVGYEREAEDFAYGLLVDQHEAREAGLVEPWDVATLFGDPPRHSGSKGLAIRFPLGEMAGRPQMWDRFVDVVTFLWLGLFAVNLATSYPVLGAILFWCLPNV